MELPSINNSHMTLIGDWKFRFPNHKEEDAEESEEMKKIDARKGTRLALANVDSEASSLRSLHIPCCST